MVLSVYTYELVGYREKNIRLLDLKASYKINAPWSLVDACGDIVTLENGDIAYSIEPEKYGYAKEFIAITNDEIYQKEASDVLEFLSDIDEEYIVIATDGQH